jgi:hypothetical protein
MNRYQVILANHDMLELNADAVNSKGDRLQFFQYKGEPDAEGQVEAEAVAEFYAWAGWNCLGKYNPPEVPPKKDELKATGPSAADIAASLQQAIEAAARKGDSLPGQE